MYQSVRSHGCQVFLRENKRCNLGLLTHFAALFTLTLPHLAIAAVFSAIVLIPMCDLNNNGAPPLPTYQLSKVAAHAVERHAHRHQQATIQVEGSDVGLARRSLLALSQVLHGDISSSTPPWPSCARTLSC